MIYESDITKLLSDWTERANRQSTTEEYKYALNECIYDLRNLLENSIEKEFAAKEYLEKLTLESFHSY